jgi:hypothetical protein
LRGWRHGTQRPIRAPCSPLREIDSSATDSGTFLMFDAVYRPVVAGQGSWEDLDKPTRWYVELVPAEEFLVINYIETKPAAGYPAG